MCAVCLWIRQQIHKMISAKFLKSPLKIWISKFFALWYLADIIISIMIVYYLCNECTSVPYLSGEWLVLLNDLALLFLVAHWLILLEQTIS